MWSSSGSGEVKQHITSAVKKKILIFSTKTVRETIVRDEFKQGEGKGRELGIKFNNVSGSQNTSSHTI